MSYTQKVYEAFSSAGIEILNHEVLNNGITSVSFMHKEKPMQAAWNTHRNDILSEEEGIRKVVERIVERLSKLDET